MTRPRDSLFVIAALFNFGIAATFILLPDMFFSLIQMEPLSSSFLFERLSGILIGFFGYGYWIVSSDPYKERSWIKVGGFAKLAVSLLFTIYVFIIPDIFFLFLIAQIDLVFSIIFWRKYRALMAV